MGQGGSLSQNKSIILSNWTEIKPNSNILYNKVTNQQIQRHEVLINDKQQLQSYANRMQDQSALICRLIYFHPKSLPKDQQARKQSAKMNPDQMLNCNRPKSMLNDEMYSYHQARLSPKNFIPNEMENSVRIYCVYTDRMMPVREWGKDKIIDVIYAFKILTAQYGLFKVRQHCICQNQRKEIKVWINQNPVSNFPVQTVEAEEDMIADLAAMLVSKKQKIAKQLLDMQHFDQAIQHFAKLQDHDHKKFTTPPGPSNTANKQTPTSHKQGEHGSTTFHLPSEVNNFYNVFINTDNSYTVNSSLQNSKYNIVNKGPFPYTYFPNSTTNHKTKETEDQVSTNNQANSTKRYKTVNELNPKSQYPSTNNTQNVPNHSQTPGFSSIVKEEQNISTKNQTINQNQISNINQVSINAVIKQNKKNQNQNQFNSGSQLHHIQTIQQKQFIDNTSIMINAKEKTKIQKIDYQHEKDNASLKQQKTIQFITNAQKKSPSSSLYSTQNAKGSSSAIPKFITATTLQLKNRQKNNSSGEIHAKKYLKTEEMMTNHSFIRTGNKDNTVSGPKTSTFKDNDKKFFSHGNQIGQSKIYSPSQTALAHHSSSYFKQESIDVGRFSEGQSLNNARNQFNDKNDSQGLIKTESSSILVSQSKLFLKSGYHHQKSTLNPNYQSYRNVVSQMSSLKPVPVNVSQLNKKSFPKYFHDKQTAKSIQKHYEKSLDQRQKSKAAIGQKQQQKSPPKASKGFGQQNFQYQPSRIRDISQNVVDEIQESEVCSSQTLPPQVTFTQSNEIFVRHPSENYQQRRKFPSTIQCKAKKLHNKASLEEKEFKYNKLGTEVSSQQSFIQSFEGTKSHFMETNDQANEQLKKSNHTNCEKNEGKTDTMALSYFSHININNSILLSKKDHHKQSYQKKVFQSDIKKIKQLDSMDSNDNEKFRQIQNNQNGEISENISTLRVRGFNINEQIDSANNEVTDSRQSLAEAQEISRKQTFPYHPAPNQRKHEKQFTFFMTSQKPTGVVHIEQINPFEPISKNRVYINKKDSLKSADQKQTLPRTTADQREKRMFKATRTSQIFVETNDLHSSDPGHKIEQIVERLEKEKERMMMNNETMSGIQEKLDTKQYPKFKKWQPSVNIYASIINQPQQQGSSIKRKEYATKSQKNQKKGSQKNKNPPNEDKQDCQDQQHPSSTMTPNSENNQNKKNFRKQVFMDYKGLFGDENPFQQQQTEEEKQKQRKLQVKKRREEEERLMQNASSKDLLIQEKVQKQKEKHAQLKSDLSKLFCGEF